MSAPSPNTGLQLARPPANGHPAYREKGPLFSAFQLRAGQFRLRRPLFGAGGFGRDFQNVRRVNAYLRKLPGQFARERQTKNTKPAIEISKNSHGCAAFAATPAIKGQLRTNRLNFDL